MKKLSILFLLAVAAIAGCHKSSSSSSSEITYLVSPAPATDAHNVLIEQFSGQSCSNCPNGNTIMDTIQNAHTGRVNVITYYEADGSEVTDTPMGAAYDFRSSVALMVGNSAIYGGIPDLPLAGIDRMPFGEPNLIGVAQWDSLIPLRMPLSDSVNINITGTCDTATHTGALTATVTYTKEMATKQTLSIMIVEDSIIDNTLFPFGMDSTHYRYDNVFRYMVTAVPYGDTLLSAMAIKEPGRVSQRTYHYTIPTTSPAIKMTHCHAIAFVADNGAGGNFQVLQSVQMKLVP